MVQDQHPQHPHGLQADLPQLVALARRRQALRLFGGLSYAQSLQRESFELKIEEAGGHGATQTETVRSNASATTEKF